MLFDMRPALCDYGLPVSSQGEKAQEPSLQHLAPRPVIQPEAEVRALPQAWTEARLHCEERRPKSHPKCRGPMDRTTSSLPVHREAIAVGKDLRHQVSRRLHQSVDPLGEEHEIRALYIPNPKTTCGEDCMQSSSLQELPLEHHPIELFARRIDTY